MAQFIPSNVIFPLKWEMLGHRFDSPLRNEGKCHRDRSVHFCSDQSLWESAFWVHFSPFPFCVAQTKKINTKKFWPTLAKNVVTLNVTETRSYIQTSMYLHPCIYIGTFIHLWTYVGTFIHLYMNVPTFLHICTNVNVRTFWVIVYYPLQLLAQIKYRYFWCFWSFRFQSFDQPFPIKPIDRKIVKPVWQVCWSDSLIIILSDCLIITAKPS